MKEQELVSILSRAYNALISEPQPSSMTSITGVTNKMLNVYVVDDSKNPPVGDIQTVSYSVKDAGLDTEEARISSVHNNNSIIQAIAEAATDIPRG